MGVNMAGNCIIDDEACCEASRQEILRRYYQALNRVVKEDVGKEEVYKIELLMKQAEISPADRKVAVAAMEVENQTHQPAVAIELDDGSIIDGKTSDLLSAPAAALLNVLKELAGIDHEKLLISPEALQPISRKRIISAAMMPACTVTKCW